MGFCRVLTEILILIMWNARNAGPFKAEPPVPIAPQPEQRPVARISVPKPEIAAYPPVRLSQPQRTKIYSHRFRDAKPINFGRASPRKLAVHGVDVSRWQGDIDWVKLRTQVRISPI